MHNTQNRIEIYKVAGNTKLSEGKSARGKGVRYLEARGRIKLQRSEIIRALALCSLLRPHSAYRLRIHLQRAKMR